MANSGPIILIDDDEEDLDLLMEVFKSLEVTNEFICFEDGSVALEFLEKTRKQPFLILSDVNMPRLNGIELLRKIHENEALRKKSIPFIFLTTTANQSEVRQAYDMTVQGYFIKGTSVQRLERSAKLLLDYWTACIHPHNLE